MVPDALARVPEMMDTPPILNNYAFLFYKRSFNGSKINLSEMFFAFYC